MTKYTVIYKNNSEAAYTSEEFKNRIELNNYLVKTGIAKANGGIKEIVISAYI